MTAAERRAATRAGLVTLTLFTAPWMIGEARGALPPGAAKEPPPCVWSVGYPVPGPSMSVKAAVSCPGASGVWLDLTLLRGREPVARTTLYGFRGVRARAEFPCVRGGRYVAFRGQAYMHAFYAGRESRIFIRRGPVMTWRCR